MNQIDEPRSDSCIQRRRSFSPETVFYSVSEYLDQFDLAALWTTPEERRKHRLDWIEEAPRLEELTLEMEWRGRVGVCIVKETMFEEQLRKLLRLE